MTKLTAGKDYIGVGVGAMVFDNQNRVFLSQRGQKSRNEAGTWEFPGGKVDFGEKLGTAIVREFKEEYGMEIELIELLNIADHILPEENQHWISPTFIARHIAGKPVILEPEKCSAIGWFDLANLPSPLSKVTITDLEAYHQRP